MPIRFKCPHCQKSLGVKDHLAGRRAKCPACQAAIVIPAPVAKPANVEEMAAAAFQDEPPPTVPNKPEEQRTIQFTCNFCDVEINAPFAEAGKRLQCPECRQIVRVPVPDEDKPKDWRQLAKKGPSAALSNMPEQLDQAWGTEQKAKVSRTALEEAGALPEAPPPRVGFLGWAKRIVIVALVAGIGFLSYRGYQRRSSIVAGTSLLAKAMESAKALQGKDKLPPLWHAELHRGIGVALTNQKKAKEAHTEFRNATGLVPGNKDNIEADLLLIELALSTIDLGGPKEQADKAEKIEWDELFRLLQPPLKALRSTPARVHAIRQMSPRLFEAGQSRHAIALAGWLKALPIDDVPKDAKSPVEAEWLAVYRGKQDAFPPEDVFPDSKKMPEPAKVGANLNARLAYVGSYCLQGKAKEALEVAGSKGPPADRFQASLAGASYLLADRRPDRQAEAPAFVQQALDIHKETPQRDTGWNLYTLVRTAALVGKGDEIKDLCKGLDPAFRGSGQFALFQGQIAKSTAPLPWATLDETITEKASLAKAAGCLKLARHNTRAGAAADPNQCEDERLRPLLLTGAALGDQDRQRP